MMRDEMFCVMAFTTFSSSSLRRVGKEEERLGKIKNEDQKILPKSFKTTC